MSTAGGDGVPDVPRLGEDHLARIEEGLRQLGALHGRLRALLGAVLAVGSDLELEGVLRTIVQSAASLADARYAALGVIGDDGMLARFLTVGVDEDTIRQIGPYPEGHGILGLLIREPRPLRLHDLTAHPDSYGFPPHHPPMNTFLGVPVEVRGQVFGNLYLTEKRGGGDFTADDEEALSALARAAGVAIDHARLYDRLRRSTEDFQRRLLPELPVLPGLGLAARYIPASDAPNIGGDWYDLICLPDGIPCLIIGDVMGHGLEAATVMSQISNILRVLAFEEQGPPSAVLRHLDRVLHALHGAPMATVLVVRLEPAPDRQGGRILRWSSAGHPPPLVTASGGHARHLDGEPGLPLGVDPDQPRPDHSTYVAPGSTVVLYTDGLIDAKGETLDDGMRHTAAVATSLADGPPGDLCDALVAARSPTRHDDIALLAIHIT